MKRALVLVVTFSCGKPTNALPTETWGITDFANAGLHIDKPWTPDNFTTAATVLKAQCTGHRDRLPHFHGQKSGEVFAKLLTPLPDDHAAPVTERFKAHMLRGEALNAISKLYLEDMLAAPSREFIEVMGSYLGEAAALATTADPFLASFGPDDPKHQTRLDGLAKMKHGDGLMMQGGLLVAEDARVPEDDRLAMLAYVTAVLPTLFPHAEPEVQQTIRDNLAKHVETTSPGKPHDAFVAARQALPPSSAKPSN
ncbi:hypothetical protein BH11MYX1_BH11MYX1_27990 [soil metagenome]